MYVLLVAVGLKVGGLLPCVLETIWNLWYNEWGGSSNPFVKNLLNGLGISCLLAGPLEVATGRSIFSGEYEAVIWLSILTAAIATTSHTQDFRDMEGDKAAGRKTVPLVIGEDNAGLVVSLGVIIWTIIACQVWGAGWREAVLPLIGGTALIGNISMNKTRRGNKLSWKLWVLWMLGLFLLPLLSR